MSIARANVDNHDPAHVSRWLAALSAGRNKAPKCQAVTKLGEGCRKLPLRGERCCNFHLKGEARRANDEKRYMQLVKEASSNCQGPLGRERAIASLAAIERRRLRWAWIADPQIPGSTMHLSTVDERRVRQLLADEGIDVDSLTPKHLDWVRRKAAIFLQGRIDRDLFERRVKAAMLSYRRWKCWYEKNQPREVDLDALSEVDGPEFERLFGFPR